jgi:non-heme chloroperoxidase
MTAWFPVTAGIRLAADIEGRWDGAPVLLLHGGGQTRRSWKQTAAALAAHGYLVVSVDQRGHGDSDWAPDGAYELGDYAEDVRRITQERGRPWIVVGASLGGLAALLAAGEHPAVNCAALVLTDAAPRLNSEGRARIRSFMLACPDGFETVEQAAEAVAAYLPHRSRPRDLSGLRNNLRLAPSGRLHWHWDPVFLARERGGADDEQRLESALALVSAPVLLVRGLLSDVVTAASIEAFRAVAPTAEYVELPDATHMVAGDRNDIFTDAVLRFLLRVAPPGDDGPFPGQNGAGTCVSA